MNAELWLDLLGGFGILILLLAGFFLAAFLVRRYMGAGAAGKEKWIRVLSVHYISHKEKFMLVQVPGQVILVGVTPSRISRLAVLEPHDIPDKDLESGTFPKILGNALGKKGKNP